MKLLLQDGYIKDAAVGRMRQEYFLEDAGRPVGTRTQDLYRVKVVPTNNLQASPL